MKRSYFTTLGLLGAFLLLLAWYFLYEKRFKGELTQKEESAKQFITLPKDQIANITIERLKNPTNEDSEAAPAGTGPAQYEKLELKKNGESWNLVVPVEDQADSSSVSSILSTLTTTKHDRVVEENPKDLGIFGLKDPIIKVTVAKDGGTETVLIGKKTPVGFGVYVKLATSGSVYKASQTLRSSLEKSPKDLRNKTIFSWVRADIGEVEVSGKISLVLKKDDKESWSLARENVPADTTETNKLLNALTDMRAVDFASEDGKNAASLGLSPETLRVVVTHLKDKSRQVLSFGQALGKTYVRKNDKNTIFEISTDTWTKLTQGSEKYRNLEVATFNRFDIKRVKIEREKDTLEFLKETSDWTLPLEPTLKLDSSKVDTLLTKLQDMRLIRYSTQGKLSTKPQFKVTLFEKKDNAEVEKVVLRFGATKGIETPAEREGLSTTFFVKKEDLTPLTQSKNDFLKAPEVKTPAKTDKSTG